MLHLERHRLFWLLAHRVSEHTLLILVGQKNDRLDMARLLQIDVKYPQSPGKIVPFVRGNLSKRVFALKHTYSCPCSFAEIGQQPCFYLFICGLTESPIASRLRSEGISPKSIVSTLMLPKLIFTFAMSRHRFNDSIFHHCPQKIRGSGCFNINHLHHI